MFEFKVLVLIPSVIHINTEYKNIQTQGESVLLTLWKQQKRFFFCGLSDVISQNGISHFLMRREKKAGGRNKPLKGGWSPTKHHLLLQTGLLHPDSSSSPSVLLLFLSGAQSSGAAAPLTWRFLCFPVRDRVRTKMERDILVEVNHPFIVKLHYGESANRRAPWLAEQPIREQFGSHLCRLQRFRRRGSFTSSWTSWEEETCSPASPRR